MDAQLIARTGTDSRMAWRVLGALWWLMVINEALPLIALSTLTPYMAEDLQLPRAMVGLLFAGYVLAMGLPGPLCAWFIGRIGIRNTLVAGNVVLVLAAAAMSSIGNGMLWALGFSIFMVGLSSAFGSAIPGQTAVTRWFRKRRAIALALLLSGGTVGGLTTPYLVAAAVESAGGNWRAGWMMVAAAGFVAIFIAAFAVTGEPKDAATDRTGAEAAHAPAQAFPADEEWTLLGVFGSAQFWMILLGATGFFTAYHIFNGQGALHIRDLGYSQTVVATCFSTAIGIGFVAQMLAGWLGDRFDPKKVWALALMGILTGLTLFTFAPSLGLLYLAVALLGGGGSMSMVCMITLLGNWFGARVFPAVFGTVNAATSVVGAAAPIAAGLSFDRLGTYTPALMSCAALCAVSAVAISLSRKPHTKQPAA